MKCLTENTKGADLLVGYLEGTLDAAERAALESHAAACPDCRALLAVDEQLNAFPPPGIPEDFDERVLARIAREEESEQERTGLSGSWWRTFTATFHSRAVATVALALVAVVAVWVARPGSGTNISADPAPKMAQNDAPADAEIEQLEQALKDLELLMPMESDTI